MKRIFREMADLLLNGESFVVATVFDQSGSVPRTSGAKMLLREDGKIRGMIGGGRQGQVLLDFIDGKDEINRIIYEEAW